MPAIPQQQTIVQYTANSSQTQYTFAFYAPLNTDIQVFYQASTAQPVPASDILQLSTDYTVTFNADPTTGGYITLLFTPTTGYYLTINRQVGASLTTNFSNAQNFNGANLDAALDRLLLLCQQNQNYALQRNLSYVINTYLPPTNINLPNAATGLPTLPQNYVWMGSSTGVVAALISTIPSASALQSLLAANTSGVDGARLVGYYDAVTSTPTTVQAFLANLIPFLQTQLQLQLFEPGMMIDYAGTSAPTGFLLCDGSAVSRATYAALFAVIGTTWGSGNGTTTFNIPDSRRRVSMGSGGSGTATIGNATGNTGGEEAHTMTTDELVHHTHPSGTGGFNFMVIGASGGTNAATGAGTVIGADTTTGNNTSAQNPFNVIQPSMIVTRVIKY